MTRAAVELAKDWRQDRALRRLEALLLVGNADHLFVLSGTGDVIEPDEGIAAIGSGGPYAQAAAAGAAAQHRARRRRDRRKALDIAGEICIYTNDDITVETAPVTAVISGPDTAALTPRQIVAELDKYIVGQAKAKRAVAIALRNRYRRRQRVRQICATRSRRRTF